MKKWVVSIVVFVLSLAVTGFIGFYSAIFLIGPHSDILPEIFRVPVGLLLLIIIIGVPTWFSKKIFKRFKGN